jgi:hypothetical protein
MAVTEPAPQLACGRDLAHLYEHLQAAQSDEHEHSCPHCREAAHYLKPVIEAARQLAADKPEQPRGFAAAVMARVRADPRRTRRLRLPADPPATLTITEHAAAVILSSVAETVPGITSRGCRFPAPGDPGHVEISVSVRYGLSVSDAFETLRTRLRGAAARDLGIQLRTVDINVEDVDIPGA